MSGPEIDALREAVRCYDALRAARAHIEDTLRAGILSYRGIVDLVDLVDHIDAVLAGEKDP